MAHVFHPTISPTLCCLSQQVQIEIHEFETGPQRKKKAKIKKRRGEWSPHLTHQKEKKEKNCYCLFTRTENFVLFKLFLDICNTQKRVKGMPP